MGWRSRQGKTRDFPMRHAWQGAQRGRTAVVGPPDDPRPRPAGARTQRASLCPGRRARNRARRSVVVLLTSTRPQERGEVGKQGQRIEIVPDQNKVPTPETLRTRPSSAYSPIPASTWKRSGPLSCWSANSGRPKSAWSTVALCGDGPRRGNGGSLFYSIRPPSGDDNQGGPPEFIAVPWDHKRGSKLRGSRGFCRGWRETEASWQRAEPILPAAIDEHHGR
jgi:hypothetical protein